MNKRKIIINLITVMLLTNLTACGVTENNNMSQIQQETDTNINNTSEVLQETNTNDNNTVTENTDDNTVAGKLILQFKEEINASSADIDIKTVAESLCSNPAFNEVNVEAGEVEPGYLAGFDGEINDFSKCVMFSPVIGTIPFVGYIFETNNSETLLETLENNANLRWNICTEADEMKYDSVGNYVIFIMSPKSFD